MPPAGQRTEDENLMGHVPVFVMVNSFMREDDLQFHGTVLGQDASVVPDNSATVNVHKYVQESRGIIEERIIPPQKHINCLQENWKAV